MNTPEIVYAINAAGWLVATGSRRFGNPTESSDWDFWCSNPTPAHLQQLVAWGFELQPVEILFGGVESVWHHTASDLVHVLVVKDAHLRRQTENLISQYFPNGYSDKKVNAAGIWRMAEQFARQCELDHAERREWVEELCRVQASRWHGECDDDATEFETAMWEEELLDLLTKQE